MDHSGWDCQLKKTTHCNSRVFSLGEKAPTKNIIYNHLKIWLLKWLFFMTSIHEIKSSNFISLSKLFNSKHFSFYASFIPMWTFSSQFWEMEAWWMSSLSLILWIFEKYSTKKHKYLILGRKFRSFVNNIYKPGLLDWKNGVFPSIKTIFKRVPEFIFVLLFRT